MLKMLQQQGRASTKEKKHRKSRRRSPSSSGGSSSDSEDAAGLGGRGMKAVRSLHKMHDRVLQYPDRIVKEFEKEVVENLGICAGQSWTLLDWVKNQNFAGNASVRAMAVYELLRNKDYKAATAQPEGEAPVSAAARRMGNQPPGYSQAFPIPSTSGNSLGQRARWQRSPAMSRHWQS